MGKLYHINPSVSRTADHKSCILIYYQEYDAFWCDNEKVWAESKCGASDCEFCIKRPDKIEVKQ